MEREKTHPLTIVLVTAMLAGLGATAWLGCGRDEPDVRGRTSEDPAAAGGASRKKYGGTEGRAGASKVGSPAERASGIKRSQTVLETLATACEDYWSLYRDYPYPNPQVVGTDEETLAEASGFRARYRHADEWDNEARNVTLVWMLSVPRDPEPCLVCPEWMLEPVEQEGRALKGPNGRGLMRVVDGFRTPMRVTRPVQYYYSRTFMELRSAGPDGKFGSPKDPKAYEDDMVRILRR